MDIGFETIIYIALGLIFVFAQVAKKKRKEAMTQSAENEEDRGDNQSPIPSFLEQMLGIPEQKPTVKKPVDNYEPLQYDLDPMIPQPGPSESISTLVNEVVSAPVKKKKVVKDGSARKKTGRQSAFDLKKAVIYKAILDRKNY